MNEHVIETQDLTVYYGRHCGIQDVNLTVEKGEVFGFLGPNGAGKTTTQRVLLDVFPPTSGKAMVFGLDCQKQGVELRRHIGYLPGELALYAGMKASEFFKMYAYLRGENRSKDHWRQLAERLDLDTSRRIRQFSRGNKQKVGVIAAFMSQPDLLILDDFGLKPIQPPGPEDLYDVINERYEHGSILLTSNRAPSEWSDLFLDPLLASAGLDRLLDRAEVVIIRGPSFRAQGRRNIFEEVQIDAQTL